MKKVFVLLAVLALAVSAFAFSASAEKATKQDVIDAVKAAVPEKYEYLYVAQMEKVLDEVNPSSNKCLQILGIIEDTETALKDMGVTDKGHTLRNYTSEEQNVLVSALNEIGDILGVTYEVVLKTTDSTGAGDSKVIVYYNNNAIAEIDGDIEQTGAEQTATLWPAAVAALGLIAAAAFVFGKKVLAA